MKGLNESELLRLHQIISQLQWRIFQGGGGNAATTSMLVRTLAQAEERSAAVERELRWEQKEHQRNEDREHALAVAQREWALSAAEREEFDSLLQHDHFTKSMFPRLEKFYIHTWDKLSDEGKDEMSKRVWEGVRRNEYQFGELPEPVKEKEAERMHRYLTSDKSRSAFAEVVPQSDRQDFCAAYEAGDKLRSYSVLERPSFARAVHHTDIHVVASKDLASADPELRDAVKRSLVNSAAVSEHKQDTSLNVGDLEIDESLLCKLSSPQTPSGKVQGDVSQTTSGHKH